MNTANVIQFSPRQSEPVDRPTGGKVADCDDGYTKIANDLLEAILLADLTLTQTKVLFAIIRKTYGFHKKTDRISDRQISEMIGVHRTHVCNVKNELLARKILCRDGLKIGLNNVISEWKNQVYENSYTVAKPATQCVAKPATKSVAKSVHTKDKRKKINKTPIVPYGDSQSADAELPVAETKKPAKKKSPPIDYQAFADAYNETLGDRLPNCAVMNDKRKRALKKLLGLLREPTVECFTAYLRGFAKRAGPFYFGDNDRGWMASLDYLLREDTLTKTKEGSLLGSFSEEDDE